MTGPDPAGPAARFQAVEELFAELVELGAAERAARLAAPGVDPAIAAEVASLLRAHESSGPLESPAGRPSLQWVGPYRVIRELGTGGMGTVYLAERQGEGFVQRVALKLLRFDFASPILVSRLVRERQILARLEHPGIARFIDGGTTPSGQPYVAMEYVPGDDLLSYCTARRLGVADRLRLLIEVAEAVHYAHGQLVVHRDLKPGNVMVTPDGRPKLLDFGIAKLAEPGEEELDAGQTGFFVTPAYASPEQLCRETVGTSSDGYALGVILYQLLTDRLPYRIDSASWAEIQRTVRETIPPRPSAVVADPRRARELAGDLDSIVLKAIAKEPERRYASAAQLADDLRRFLAGQPVVARPDSVRYRARKFVRRHRIAVVAAGTTAIALLGGIGVAGWQATVATRQREDAVAASQRARAVSDFVIGLFEAADPLTGQADLGLAGQILARGLDRVDELADQPAEQARTLEALGRIAQALGRYDQADTLLERSLALRRALDDPVERARSVAALGNFHLVRGRTEAAAALFTEGLELLERAHGPDHPDVATAILELCRALRIQGLHDSAEVLNRRAIALRRAAFGPDAEATISAEIDLATLEVRMGRYPEAEALLQELVDRGRRVLGPDHLITTEALLQLAEMTTIWRADTVGQAPRFREALAGRERTFGPDHPHLLHPLNSLAVVAQVQGRLDEAETLYRRTIAIHERALGPNHPRTLVQWENLGGVLFRMGRRDEGLRMIVDAIATRQRIQGERHPAIAGSLTTVAARLEDLGNRRGADSVMRLAIAIRREANGERSQIVAWTLRRYGEMLWRWGQREAALAQLDTAFALVDGRVDDRQIDMARLLEHLETAARALGDLERAEALRKRRRDAETGAP